MVQTAETAEGAATFIVPEWTPADTEESVVGTQWHQQASGALVDILEEVGRRHGASWGGVSRSRCSTPEDATRMGTSTILDQM